MLLDDIDGQPGQLDLLHAGNLPHKPWTVVPSLQSYTDPGELDQQLEHESEAYVPQVELDDRKRHLLEVGAADSLVGEMMDKIEAEGAWEETLLVVVADHGISFRPHTGRRRASDNNLDQLAFVPLFIKLPGQRRGRTDPAPVQTIDAVPAIAAELGVEIPWEVDGALPGERSTKAVEVVNYKGRMIDLDAARAVEAPEPLRRRAEQAAAHRPGLGRPDRVRPRVRADRAPRARVAPGRARRSRGPPLRRPRRPRHGRRRRRRGYRGAGPRQAARGRGRRQVAAATRTVGAADAGVRFEAVLPPKVYEDEVGEVQVLLVRKDGGFALLGSS